MTKRGKTEKLRGELKNSNSYYKLDSWLDIHILYKSINLVLNLLFSWGPSYTTLIKSSETASSAYYHNMSHLILVK